MKDVDTDEVMHYHNAGKPIGLTNLDMQHSEKNLIDLKKLM